MIRVVKLGGSLFDAPELELWLKALAEHGAGDVVIVPGGGPFADAVRSAQQRRRFSDATAHRMAMLGMAQYGLMLAGMEDRLVCAEGKTELLEVLAEGRVAVWLPDPMQSGMDLAASWDFTSDSVAAWLAKALDATALLMVKSVPVSGAPHRFKSLQARQIVDSCFAGTCRNAAFRVWLADRSGHTRFGAWMNGAAEYVPVAAE